MQNCTPIESYDGKFYLKYTGTGKVHGHKYNTYEKAYIVNDEGVLVDVHV